MPTVLNTRAIEESAYTITFAFTDEDGNDVTPDDIKWKLTDGDGTVVNSRTDVSLTPSTSVDVDLNGDDLALADHSQNKRIVTIYGTYTSGGSSRNLKDAAIFFIDPLTAIS